MSADERALLNGFLGHDCAGVQELRLQADHMVAKRGCKCGCGTIEFISDGATVPRCAAANPVPVDALVRDTRDEVGGLILFVSDGMLQSMEIYSYAEPLPLSPLNQVTWRA